MNPNENAIRQLKSLITILESNVKVIRAECFAGLGDPMEMTLDGTTWSHIYKVEIEMCKAPKVINLVD